jgi:ABC-type polysaccharide/polyol phosphate transport system ATPase subunit
VKNPENAIEVCNMSKSFKLQYDGAHTLKELIVRQGKGKKERHLVLDHINLDIKKGESVALVGTNGSGKSTLLKLMTKIIFPTSGTVETNGKLTSLLELGAGFHQDFTGRENIYFNAAVFGLTEKEINDRIDDIIDFSELGSAIDEPIRTYSSGMYMRLAFSVAISVDAEILLIDEILAVGDQHFQEKCFAKLRELRDSDKTIVIVSHSLDVVKDLCARAVWIYDTHIKMDADPVDVCEAYLEQIEIDNQVNKEKELTDGTAQYRTIITIDTPKPYQRFKEKTSIINIDGWKMCDAKDAVLKLTANGKEIQDVTYSERPDIVVTFREEFGGLFDPKKVGWKAKFIIGDYADKNGRVNIIAQLKKPDGTLLGERNVIVVLDER